MRLHRIYAPWLIISCACMALASGSLSSPGSTAQRNNNWAVLVGTSVGFFNYRHQSNVLGMYRSVKRLGIPDSNIILMLADDAACDPRNKYAGAVYSNSARAIDLYGENVEVDYRGDEVTVENFIRLITGRVDPSTPRSKRLLTDERSNIFIYMTGHGGDEFLKFRDAEEISAFDLADAFQQMKAKRRYNEIFFMTDTCQANTLYSQLYSPNVLATGSSAKDENSYSHHSDHDIGVAVIDRYTHWALNFLEGINKTSHTTMADFFGKYNFEDFNSNAGVRSDLLQRPVQDILMTDFFGGVVDVELTASPSADAVPRNTRERQPSTHVPAIESQPAREEPTAGQRKADGVHSSALVALLLIAVHVGIFAISVGKRGAASEKQSFVSKANGHSNGHVVER